MVDFAGYALPVTYSDGVMESHNHCRSSASIFDVSHMGQVEIHGEDRVAFMESLVVADIQALPENHCGLSVLTNEKGGIIDDLIITNKPDHIFLVVNGACKHGDMAHIQKHMEAYNAKHGSDLRMKYIDDRALIALQGPKAMDVLSQYTEGADLSQLAFMTTANAKVNGVHCWVTRCGYTGEDGFEISIPNESAAAITEALLAHKEGETENVVKMAALGPRDSLRLEAGLCLYGSDLNEDITPVEASLNWTIGKRRRAEGGFVGSDVILQQLKDKKVDKKRVGLDVLKGAPARGGATIHDTEGNEIGYITSGTMSPSTKKKISMGYVDWAFRKAGTAVQIKQRGRFADAKISKMPWVQCHYYKPE